MIHAKEFIVSKAWKILVKDFGLRADEISKRARLPEDIFIREDTTLTAEEYFRLWLSLETILDDPAFPLLIIDKITAETFSPPLFAALCSPNMNIAMARLSKYKQLVGPMKLTVDSDNNSLMIKLDCLYTEHPLPHSLIAFEFLYLVNLIRMATRENIRPLSVTSSTELPKIEKYREYFGITPIKGKINQIIFSHEDAVKPFLTENENMWDFFEPELRKRLSDFEHATSFAERVSSSLLELIPSGLCSSDDVAKKLAISKRTLYRHLNNENTTFQQILNKIREKLARHYLTNSDLSGAEISFLLGFDDPNSFVRAFRSWTGETPGKLRAS